MVGADAKVEGLSVEAAINVIKQKPFSDLTPNDYAFLKARQDYLSDADKAIYLEGEDPAEVLEDAGAARTREERIIRENLPLQERQEEISDAKHAASVAEKSVGAELTPEQKDEKQKARADARKAKAKELKEAVALQEKEEAEAAKEAKKAPKEGKGE